MARNAATVPAETDWLCEGCGYVLTGLPSGGNCPECGNPMVQSAIALRQLPAWEDRSAGRSAVARFFMTTADVLFRPTQFFRTMATRQPRTGSLRFAAIHLGLCSVLFGIA